MSIDIPTDVRFISHDGTDYLCFRHAVLRAIPPKNQEVKVELADVNWRECSDCDKEEENEKLENDGA